MKRYNPEVPPVAAEWLAIDEQLRIELVESYHRAARVEVPNHMVHAAFHAIVENQIAEGLEPVVRAMARLMKQGLSRHDALHAIGSVVAEHLFDAMNGAGVDFTSTAQARYNAAVERLTAQAWRRKYE